MACNRFTYRSTIRALQGLVVRVIYVRYKVRNKGDIPHAHSTRLYRMRILLRYVGARQLHNKA